MADNKKYYYLKLKENFFDSDEIIILESMEKGYLYSNILLKLYLRSLKNEGKLMFNDRIPFNTKMLAQVTRHSENEIENALQVFEDLKLVEILDNGAIFMNDIQNFIGKSSTHAERQKEYRRRIANEKEQTTSEKEIVKNNLNKAKNESENICVTNVKQALNKNEPEKEIEIEKSYRESESYNRVNILSGKPDPVFPNWLSENAIEVIKKSNPENYDKHIPIAYLNQKTGKAYKFVAKNTKLVNARLKEGYTLEDFKTVIDKKTDEWENNADMAKYLRPETLFGTKFDSYLNQSTPPQRVNGYLYDEDLPF